MGVCAIVAEYDPLHLGHRYHLGEARARSRCEHVVVVMSGNFTQRGTPSMTDKWSRARMALAAGADIVLELPAGYAVQTAEWFAKGAVGILTALGVVTHLSFGAETENPALLRELAALTLREPEGVSRLIRLNLARGLSHPAARAEALCAHMRSESGEERAGEARLALRAPNNILGILYMRALAQMRSQIEPVVIARRGAGYHERDIAGAMSSATAIRAAILEGRDWNEAVPDTTCAILTECLDRGHGPVSWRDFERMLLFRLRTMTPGELAELPDIAEGLHNRIAAAAAAGGSFEDLMRHAKVRRYGATRLTRAAVHALLAMTRGDVETFRTRFPLYARVLGLRESARPLLARIARRAAIPVITRPSRFKPEEGAMERLWALDLRATDLYSLALQNESDRRSGRDYTQPLIRL